MGGAGEGVGVVEDVRSKIMLRNSGGWDIVSQIDRLRKMKSSMDEGSMDEGEVQA